MDIKEILFEKNHFSDIREKLRHNYHIADFYYDMYEISNDPVYLNISGRVNGCSRYLYFDCYYKQQVKDLQRMFCCRDKFCLNCQSMLAQKRMQKFTPQLDKYRKDYKICHMVVTVPNCAGEDLQALLDQMYKKFPYLIRYFNGRKMVRGVNFLSYGYGGCVRSLEVSYNRTTGEYHPHFHCMILLCKDLDLTQRHTNSYSFDYGKHVKDFSDIEILVQKVWYLLMNNIKVTKSAIDELCEGYSVDISDSEGRYHECFKYAMKGVFDPVEGTPIHQWEIFITLYKALYCRRIIQGYGLLHNFYDFDSEILEEEVTKVYERYVKHLRAVECPIPNWEDSLESVIQGCDLGVKYISKNNLKRLISERMREENSDE